MNYGPVNPKLPKMIHGGDYNPDQWLKEPSIIDEDFRLFELAACNAMSIGIFSWAALEPEEGHYTFEWLDEIMDRLASEGRYAILATPSGARPAWMSQKYPEVLRVDAERRRQLHGERHNHCYTSPVYRKKIRQMNQRLAERYKDHPALLLWHVSNEYGGECHCEKCQAEFRNWLRIRYNDDLEALNDAWWTGFWSHRYSDWSQIESPSPIGEQSIHGLVLDWKRFVTYQTRDFMRAEIHTLKEIAPNIPVTTNFMWLYEGLDYWKMSGDLDVISWDSYPTWHDLENPLHMASKVAFIHDMHRSFKQGQPFLLMESTPSMTNWQEVSKLKRPGMHRLSSLQAVAHGADSVQYFQWRKSRGSFEKFHGAVVGHSGHENTRVFKDVAEVGKILGQLDDVVGTSIKPEVAVIYDWENRWALNNAKGLNNSAKNYSETVIAHHRGFWNQGIATDVIDQDQSFESYKLIVAPMLYMVKEGVGQKIEEFVKQGGIFVTTYVSGMVNDNDLCFLGGFPGPLRKVLGIWAEETDSLYPDDENFVSVSWNENTKKDYLVKELCDLIHLETAQSMGVYKQDFYAGQPALTCNQFGKGKAYYIAFRNNGIFEQDFYHELAQEVGIKPVADIQLTQGVSMTKRMDEKHTFIFLMNFLDEEVSVDLKEKSYKSLTSQENITGKILLPGYGSLVLQEN